MVTLQSQINNTNPIFTPFIQAGQPTGASAPNRAPQTLIDWNNCQPDGTRAALQSVVSQLALAFCGDVFVGTHSPSGKLELTSSCTLEETARRALISSAITEAMATGKACVFATRSGQTSLLLQQTRESNNASLVMGFGNAASSVNSKTPCSFGVIVSVNDTSSLQTKEIYAELISRTQNQLQPWLQTWRCCQIGASVNRWQARLQAVRGRKGRIASVAALIGLLCLMIPVPYWPQRACVVEPASKSFVSSPIDGRIREATVRPGDSVMPGQLLARLDDEQLRRSLSAAEAEFEAAGKRRDSALATRASGEMRLAQLEQERIALEIESLQAQLAKLELHSPSAGIVVQGDWFQSDGAPVARGDVLFEIAPIDRMRVEIHLSTDDLATIGVDELATIRVDAAPGKSWSAKLNRIDPRGQVIDSEVVFVANIEVENEGNLLRPGMKGTARITAEPHSIGWLLFHRPSMWVMKKLVW